MDEHMLLSKYQVNKNKTLISPFLMTNSTIQKENRVAHLVLILKQSWIRGTHESINIATQLYVGPTPKKNKIELLT